MRCVESLLKPAIWLSNLLLSFALLTSFNSASAANSQSSIPNLFNSGRYAEALKACELAIKERPLEPNLRYWRASILVKLQRVSEARNEYQYVQEYSANKLEIEYARKACVAIDSAALRGNQPLYSGQPNGATSPVKQVNPSVERITRQADVDSSGILMNGVTKQNYYQNRSAQEAAYQSDMRAVDAMSSASLLIGNKKVPRYSPEEIQFQRNLVIDHANQVKAENDARAAEALQVAQQKAFETQAAAANLAAQLNNAPKSGFHLREEGTNLYVRQYNAPPQTSSNMPNPATVTVHDSADAVGGKFESPLQASARALDPVLQKQLDLDSKRNIQSNVYGRIKPLDSHL